MHNSMSRQWIFICKTKSAWVESGERAGNDDENDNNNDNDEYNNENFHAATV